MSNMQCLTVRSLAHTPCLNLPRSSRAVSSSTGLAKAHATTRDQKQIHLRAQGLRLASNASSVTSLFRGRLSSRQPARSHKRASLRPRAAAQSSVAADAGKPVENDSGLLKYFTDDVGRDVLAGITVALALVPEALAFTFVAGVHPLVGLHGAMLMSGVVGLFGGRPGMISGAAGSTAVVTGALVATHGVEYMFACMAMAGGMQLVFGWLRLGKLIRLVPRAAMLGFVNGLAIVILDAQMRHFQSAPGIWLSGTPLYTMAGLTALTMLIIEVVGRITKKIPGPLVAIGVVTSLVKFAKIDTKTLGDLAAISGALPSWHVPNVALSPETLMLVLPFAAAVAAVGLIETLLTQSLVDEMTQTRSRTHTECVAQGLGNLVNGFFGGMGGCAMIGQTIINLKSGGRGRLSGVTCSLAIALFIVCLSSVIEIIPMAALVGVMIKVVIDTFAWKSLAIFGKIPKTDAFVLVAVTAITVVSNLAVAVVSGVVISALGFAYKQSTVLSAVRTLSVMPVKRKNGGLPKALYTLQGPLFFASVMEFQALVDPAKEAEEIVVLDFKNCRVWDQSGLEAIDNVALKFKTAGKQVVLQHLSPDSARLLKQADDLVDVNIEEDPTYAVVADYPTMDDHKAANHYQKNVT